MFLPTSISHFIENHLREFRLSWNQIKAHISLSVRRLQTWQFAFADHMNAKHGASMQKMQSLYNATVCSLQEA